IALRRPAIKPQLGYTHGAALADPVQAVNQRQLGLGHVQTPAQLGRPHAAEPARGPRQRRPRLPPLAHILVTHPLPPPPPPSPHAPQPPPRRGPRRRHTPPLAPLDSACLRLAPFHLRLPQPLLPPP